MKDELLPQKSQKTAFSWALSEKKYLKLSEVNKLKKACQRAGSLISRQHQANARNWFMISLGLNTGLRVEEMRDLKCGDLNIQQGQASVSVRKGKGNKPRNVKINKNFRNKCKRFLNWKKEQGQSIDADSYLLTNNEGKQLSKRALQKAFKKCIQKAGLPSYYSLHSLRHTYATFLLKASNNNLRIVQDQLGHSSVRITEIYTSLIGSEVKKAVEKLYH